jgi:hypothetical protein
MKIPDYVSINTTIIAVFFLIWFIKYPEELKAALFLEFKYPEDVHASLIVWLLLTILLVGATYIAVAILYPN